MHIRRLFHCAVALFVWLAIAPAASAQDARLPLRVAVSADLHGQLASLRCSAVREPGAFRALAAEFAGEPGALGIDAGNLIGAGALSRLALAHDPDAVARAIVDAGIRVLSVGHNDLAAPRATLLAAARALDALGARYILGNLTCGPAARALCATVLDAGDPVAVFDTPSGRVAVIAAIAPAWLAYVARDRAAGLRLADPAVSIARDVRRARAAGADWVIATYDPDSDAPLEHAITLADALPADARPDALFVNGFSDRAASLESAHGVTIVATRAGHVIALDRAESRPARPARTGAVPEAVSQFAVATTDWLCATLGQQLAGGAVAGAMGPGEFANLLIDVARQSARAEIGLINRGAIEPETFPVRGALTRLDVVAALPFDNGLRVASVRGSVLLGLARSPRAGWFYFRGLEVAGDSVRVNGRALDEDRTYRVVTTDYVADGGDGGVGDDAARWTVHGTEPLRDVLLAWLARPRDGTVDRETLDLSARTRWTLRWTLDGTVNWVAVANPNPAVYFDAQVSRSQAFSLRGETEVRADADHPAYTFDNSLRLRYGLARTISLSGADSGFTESADLITARSTVTYRALRGTHPRWYLPLPFGELFSESEFSCPCPAPRTPGDPPMGRQYHHLLFRPTVGARFEFTERFYLFAGLGADWEVFQPSNSFAPIGVVGWVLRPGRLFTIGDRGADAESSLDVSYRDPFGAPSALVRFRAKLSLPLFDPLALTLTYDLFARNDAGQPEWAWASDLSVGLKVTFIRAAQGFWF